MLTVAARRLAGAAVVAVAVAGCGPAVVQAGPGAAAGPHLVEVTMPAVTTTVGGGSGAFDVGQCLSWDQSATDATFTVVPCTDAHLVEVTAVIDLSDSYTAGASVPTAAGLADLATSRCGPAAAAYLGRDLAGEAPGIILPSTPSWDGGDREAWCTVGLERVDGKRPSYVGSLRAR